MLVALYKVRFQNLILLGAKTKCWSDQTLAAIYNFLRLEPSRYFTPFLSFSHPLNFTSGEKFKRNISYYPFFR